MACWKNCWWVRLSHNTTQPPPLTAIAPTFDSRYANRTHDSHFSARRTDPEFTALQTGFLTQHARYFEPSSATNTPTTTPNTLHHTQLHQQYTTTIESFLLTRLHAALPTFDLPSLGGLLEGRGGGDEWSDVLDVLSGLSDYLTFKELMMDKRAEMDEEEESIRQAKAGKQVVKSKRQELNDFGLHITSLKQVQAKRSR